MAERLKGRDQTIRVLPQCSRLGVGLRAELPSPIKPYYYRNPLPFLAHAHLQVIREVAITISHVIHLLVVGLILKPLSL